MQQQLSHYQIKDLLGEGSFAWVYRALDERLERQVALKVLKPAWLSDPQALARFKQEAKTMAKLHHPNIAVVYEVGETQGQVYLAQFLVEGETLAARLTEGPLPWSEVLNILRPLASALDYAHGLGIVHRDIKPSNILLHKNGQAYLSDFGLVRAAEGSVALSTTTAGGMIGTPAYMAPEQWEGQPVTSVADVYALVCVVVETLTGQVLFDGSTPAVVMRQHLIIGPELPAEWPQDVPEGVTEVLRRGLATDPAERIRSVGELVAGLEALRAAPRPAVSAPAPASTPAPQPPAPRRSSKGLLAGGVIALVGGAVVLVVIVGTILYFALQPGPSPTSEPVLAKTEEVAKNEPTEEVPSEPRETITVVETVEVEKIVTVEVEKIVTVEVEAEVAEVAPVGEVIQATPGEAVDLVLLPKFLGILVFDQVNDGAREAAAELQNPSELQFLGPTPENSVAGQIDIVTTVATQGMDGIMISNNASDQLVPAVQAAKDAGMTVVTWDSPIPSAEGEDVFIAQVDFDQTGQVMADMALSILGDEGGQFAVLSASPDASNQNAWIAAMEVALEDSKYANLELVDIVYGNDQSDESYNQALALVDKYPDMELIMAPTTVGITAAAKAMQDEGLCNTVKVSGLGLPAEMVSYTLNGCAPEFALWSFVDMGYLTYYTTYLLATGQMQAAEGVTFEAGRMGIYTIEKDPTRDVGLRVLMGPWTVYTADNVEAAAE